MVILLSGCGPLVPMSYDLKAPPANLSQTINTPEASITLEFIQRQYGYDIYDLEVINNSSAALEFAPQNIIFYASPHVFPLVTDTTDDVQAISESNSALLMKRAFADSPGEVDRVYRQKSRNKAGASVFLAILATGLVIYDEVKDSNDSKKETWTKKDQRNAAGRDLLTNVAITAAEVARADALEANEDNYYLPYELFPVCSIKQGESVRGKIFIRVENSYRYSRLLIPLPDTDYVFDLKRRGVKSKSKE